MKWLLSDGSEVAVKVQYPNAQRLFAEDMKTIRSFFKLFAPEQLLVLDELSRSFVAEFDLPALMDFCTLSVETLSTTMSPEVLRLRRSVICRLMSSRSALKRKYIGKSQE